MLLNDSLRYGFQYEQYLNSIGWAINFQFWVPLMNLFLIHPLMLFVLYSNRPSMSRRIFWGYILTEAGVIIFDISTFLLRIYFIAPYAAIYCEGPLCRKGIPKSVLMTIVSFAIVANIPCFIFLLVRMHQAITTELNPRWKLSECTQYALFAFFSISIGLNVPGFAFFAKESDDVLELYKQPELQWLLSRGGTIFLFGDYGKPQYFIYGRAISSSLIRLIGLKHDATTAEKAEAKINVLTELYLLGITIISVAPPVIIFFVQSMQSLRKTKKISLSTKTQAMAQRMFQVFLWQMSGAFFCLIMPVSLLFIFIMFDLRWFVPDAPSTFLRLVCLCLLVLDPSQFCLVYIIKTFGLYKTLKLITETLVKKLLGRSTFSMSTAIASSGQTTSKAIT